MDRLNIMSIFFVFLFFGTTRTKIDAEVGTHRKSRVPWLTGEQKASGPLFPSDGAPLRSRSIRAHTPFASFSPRFVSGPRLLTRFAKTTSGKYRTNHPVCGLCSTLGDFLSASRSYRSPCLLYKRLTRFSITTYSRMSVHLSSLTARTTRYLGQLPRLSVPRLFSCQAFLFQRNTFFAFTKKYSCIDVFYVLNIFIHIYI